jgi:hypothetical protein
VVVAAYNSSDRIVPTLRSALAQTYARREVIVVGDGCTDDTGDVIRNNFGDRVRWINLKRNFGTQAGPNNRGIRAARGTHIAYLGHDDIWSPHHLAALAATIAASDPDFAVSGAIYHTPEGTDLYNVTGLFEDGSAAKTLFFPPSSFAHRRSVVEKIGMWGDPAQLRQAVDSDFLLRAAGAGCTFASTKRITVHKFAAGHRYLFYRFPSSREQAAMLEQLADPEFETRLITGILGRVAAGATILRPAYRHNTTAAPGEAYRAARSAKGLALTATLPVEQSTRLPLESGPAALDWRPLVNHPEFGPIRWSGPNPNPNYLLNARIGRRFALRIHLAFGDAPVLPGMRLKVDGRDTDYQVDPVSPRRAVLTVRPELPLPVENGILLTFETYPPGAPRPDIAFPAERFALAGVDIVLD